MEIATVVTVSLSVISVLLGALGFLVVFLLQRIFKALDHNARENARIMAELTAYRALQERGNSRDRN